MPITNPSSYAKSMARSINSRTACDIMMCKIVDVNYKSCSANVFIYEYSLNLENVPIAFPSRGNTYGAYFMPVVNSNGIVVLTSQKYYYLIPSYFLSTTDNLDIVLPGEILNHSYGQSFSKVDILGNNITGAKSLNTVFLHKSGVNFVNSIGNNIESVAHKEINGFGFDLRSLKDRDFFNKDELKLINYSEYYTSMRISKVYKREDILTTNSYDKKDIDETISEGILSDARDVINSIKGLNYIPGIKDYMVGYKNDLKNLESTDQEFEDKINEIFTLLNDTFILPHKGVKIVIEKGNSLERELNNINEIKDIVDSDYSLSEQSNPVCLKLSIKDIDTNSTKAYVAIDTEGNLHIKFKTVTIETDAGITQY